MQFRNYHFAKFVILFAFLFPAITFSQTGFQSPESVVEELFRAANEQDFNELGTICDPENQNDGDTECLCSLGENYSRDRGCRENISTREFTEAFRDGRLEGEVIYSGDGSNGKAVVPFRFGPKGDRKEEMHVIQRDGNWYLLSF